jgi:hypothetical protein
VSLSFECRLVWQDLEMKEREDLVGVACASVRS